MKKRLLSITLTLILIISSVLPAIAADSSSEEVDITWLPQSIDLDNIEMQDNGIVIYYIKELDRFAMHLSLSEYDPVTYRKNVYCMVDRQSGAVVTSDEYDFIYPFSDGVALVEKIGMSYAGEYVKYGYIDEAGKVVVPVEYDVARDFSNGIAWIGRSDTEGNTKWGCVDKTGKVVVPLEYDYAGEFVDGLAEVMKYTTNDNAKLGYIDTNGRVVIPLEYDAARDFSDGIASVGKSDTEGIMKWGCIDKTGKVVVPLEYYSPLKFSEDLAKVKSDDWKYGYIDKTGKMVIPLEYDDARYFSEGLAWVVKEDSEEVGYIDKSGKMVISLNQDLMPLGSFSDGLALAAKLDSNANLEKWEFIDKNGEVVMPLEFDSALGLSDGIALVANCDTEGHWKYGYIDKTGEVIVPVEYDFVYDYLDGNILSAETNGYFTQYHSPNNSFSYTLSDEFFCSTIHSDGLLWVAKNDEDVSGCFNIAGDVVLPTEYDFCYKVYDGSHYSSSGQFLYVVKGASIGIVENPYYNDSHDDGKGNTWFYVLPVIVLVMATVVAVLVIRKSKTRNETSSTTK